MFSLLLLHLYLKILTFLPHFPIKPYFYYTLKFLIFREENIFTKTTFSFIIELTTNRGNTMSTSLHFRNLKAEEIECRIGTINEKGLSLLLYKNARVDQDLLDETVGPYNWKREHSRENANCTVSLWDNEKQQWITKEDTGTESNTEKEKGLASDSFKRACFNWGIGRELYTAPFIWIPSTKFNLETRNNRPTTRDQFSIAKITYKKNSNGDELKQIENVAIINTRTRQVVFSTVPLKASKTSQDVQKDLKKSQSRKQEIVNALKEES